MIDMWWARIGGQMGTLLRTGRGVEVHEKLGDATEWRTYQAAMLENARRRLLLLHRCHSCGHIDARNRIGVAFVCLACGHTGHAHVNAAGNILQAGLARPAARVACEEAGGFSRQRSYPGHPVTIPRSTRRSRLRRHPGSGGR